MIANLHEFNQLRYEFNLNGTKSPSVSASLAVAKSAIRRAPQPGDVPRATRSGIYFSRLISKQARHVINHKELFVTLSGNHMKHKSILDDMKIREALFFFFSWVASKSPGEVSLNIASMEMHFPVLQADFIHSSRSHQSHSASTLTAPYFPRLESAKQSHGLLLLVGWVNLDSVLKSTGNPFILMDTRDPT
jgi:hypothetical protein